MTTKRQRRKVAEGIRRVLAVLPEMSAGAAGYLTGYADALDEATPIDESGRAGGARGEQAELDRTQGRA